MALRFVDGFDAYVTADLTKKWTSSSSLTISAGNGRRGTSSLRATATNQIVRGMDNQATWIVGFALRTTARPGTTARILEWNDGGTNQTDLRLTTTGTFQFTRNGTNIGSASAYVLPLNAYVYLEALVTVHNTAGVVTLRADNAVIVTGTSLDTQNTANAYANTLNIGCFGGNNLGTQDIDDFYICDGNGSAPHNTFLGDSRVDTLFPTSDGTHQQWTPSTPGTHYTLVDETAPNTTDYVASSTVGHRDTYGMQDLSAMTGTIYGVQLGLAALKSDAGARAVKPLILSGGSEALGTATALSTSQTYTLHVQTTDPATGLAWSESAINSMQCGVETA